MVALGQEQGGGIYDHVPIRLLSTITLLISQIVKQWTNPVCRDKLNDMATDNYSYKLRRTRASAGLEMMTGDSKDFVFLHDNLLRHIDFGVLYILDHPYCTTKTGVSRGHHSYLYYLQSLPATLTSIPDIHFKRLPIKTDEDANRRLRGVTRVSATLRYVYIKLMSFLFSYMSLSKCKSRSDCQFFYDGG